MQHYHQRLRDDRDCFVFDLDNTLYPHESALFPQVEKRIGDYVQQLLSLPADQARTHQKKLFMEHGTTLAGLMKTEGVDPRHYLDFVHDIDFSPIEQDAALRDALLRLGGRRVIYTNADLPYTEKVLDRLGLADLFDDIFDIAAADLTPKPDPAPYDQMLKRFGVDPKRAIMFEDMARNLVPAAQRGMGGVWVKTGTEWGQADHSTDAVHAETSALTPWLVQYAQDREAHLRG